MTLHHSEETHKALVARIPEATGRELKDWFDELEQGPAFLRFDDKVQWPRSEHELSHGQATAIVHEYDMKKAARNMG